MSNSIVGMTGGQLTFESTGGSFARADGQIGGIQIFGSDSAGSDLFNITSLAIGDTLFINGLAGNDVFNIGNEAAGDILLDGNEDSDVYNFEFGSTAERDVVIQDSGNTGTDTLNLIGSDSDDNIIISSSGVSDGNSSLSFDVPLNVIEIMGLDGNDTFIIDGSPTDTVILHGNSGNDTFVINSTTNILNIDLFAGIGNDVFRLNGSSDPTRIDAHGSVGQDVFSVAAGASGRIFIDGEQGSDSYNVNFAGAGERRIFARDTGTDGNDALNVSGTAAADRVAIRTTRFLYDDEVVIFDENTEHAVVDTGGGNDRIVVFGSRSPLTEAFAGSGSDNFVMNSGSRTDTLNLSGEEGNDTFLIRKTTVDTTTNLFGNSGNDRFNIGSTVNQDDGNLGLIRGELNVFGGSNELGEEDQLVANDNGVNAAYSYQITPNSITPIAGPFNLPRSIFAGINYNSSVELVRLDGTQQVNLFQVLASQTTRYFIDGNAPSNALGDEIELMFEANDGRKLTVTDSSAGNGVFTFGNGNERIQFQNIELQQLSSNTRSFLIDANESTDDFFSTLKDGDEIEFDLF